MGKVIGIDLGTTNSCVTIVDGTNARGEPEVTVIPNADGARTTSLGAITFPLVMKYVSDILTVTDEELLRTMFWLWERTKLVVEPTGALAACAVLERKIQLQKLRVGVILSGGNVDLRWAAAKMQER